MGSHECGDDGVGWVLYHDDGFWIGPPEVMVVCGQHWDDAHHAAAVDTLVIDAEERFEPKPIDLIVALVGAVEAERARRQAS